MLKKKDNPPGQFDDAIVQAKDSTAKLGLLRRYELITQDEYDILLKNTIGQIRKDTGIDKHIEAIKNMQP